MTEEMSNLSETEIKALAEKVARWLDELTPSERAYFETVAMPLSVRESDDTRGYTQFVQMSTQLMNEFQNTERELVDALQSQHRNAATFWETVAGLRNVTFQTTSRIIATR